MKNIIIIIALLIIGAGGYVWWSNTKGTEVYTTNQTENQVENKVGEIKKENMTNPHIILKTNKGEIEIELLGDKAPNTVTNFVKLANEGFYNGTRFHRVIKGFMIQGGDPLSKDVANRASWGTGGPGYSFADEFNDTKLVKGILAMANSGPNTNGSQFFIVTAESTPWLDGKHTSFGKVVRGMDIVEAIEGTKTGQADQPVEDMLVEKVTVVQ